MLVTSERHLYFDDRLVFLHTAYTTRQGDGRAKVCIFDFRGRFGPHPSSPASLQRTRQSSGSLHAKTPWAKHQRRHIRQDGKWRNIPCFLFRSGSSSQVRRSKLEVTTRAGVLCSLIHPAVNCTGNLQTLSALSLQARAPSPSSSRLKITWPCPALSSPTCCNIWWSTAPVGMSEEVQLVPSL